MNGRICAEGYKRGSNTAKAMATLSTFGIRCGADILKAPASIWRLAETRVNKSARECEKNDWRRVDKLGKGACSASMRKDLH